MQILAVTNKERTHTDREMNFKQAHKHKPYISDRNISEKSVDMCCGKTLVKEVFHCVYNMETCEYTNHVLCNTDNYLSS